MNEEIIQSGGAFESPKDYRAVYVDEVYEQVAGTPSMPEEMFSPYTVAAYLKNGTNNQFARQSCVGESGDKGGESLSVWENTPDTVLDKDVIDYLFITENGKIRLKAEISEKIKNFSPTFIYYWAKQKDGIPNNDGTYLVMVGKIGQEIGFAEESLHPSNGITSESAVRNTVPSKEANDNAATHKIERYAQSRNTLESWKQGIAIGNANGIILGYSLGGGSNVNTQPQTPPTSQPDSGHANWGFGYDKDYVYSIGSWTENYGLTLYLKVFNHPKFGKVFVRGVAGDHVVAIKGCHQISRAWFPQYAFQGVMLYDKKFTPELEKRTAMLKTMREDVTGRVFAILAGKRYWVTPGGAPGTTYEDGRGRVWQDVSPDQIPAYSRPEIRQYPLGGIWGKPSWAEFLSLLMGQI